MFHHGIDWLLGLGWLGVGIVCRGRGFGVWIIGGIGCRWSHEESLDGMLLGAVGWNDREDGDGEAVEGVCSLGLWSENN